MRRSTQVADCHRPIRRCFEMASTNRFRSTSPRCGSPAGLQIVGFSISIECSPTSTRKIRASTSDRSLPVLPLADASHLAIRRIPPLLEQSRDCPSKGSGGSSPSGRHAWTKAPGGSLRQVDDSPVSRANSNPNRAPSLLHATEGMVGSSWQDRVQRYPRRTSSYLQDLSKRAHRHLFFPTQGTEPFSHPGGFETGSNA